MVGGYLSVVHRKSETDLPTLALDMSLEFARSKPWSEIMFLQFDADPSQWVDPLWVPPNWRMDVCSGWILNELGWLICTNDDVRYVFIDTRATQLHKEAIQFVEYVAHAHNVNIVLTLIGDDESCCSVGQDTH